MGNCHVFVGGLHRSGTTALAQQLAAHPDVSDFHETGVPRDEGQFLQHVFPADEVYGGPGWCGFAEKAHLTEGDLLENPQSRTELREAWMPYWDKEKRVLLEKSPMNLIRSRFLQDAFPNSYFVFLVRHPVVTALATQKWSKTSLASLVEHWLHCHRLVIDDARHLRATLFVNYEHLCADPSGTLAGIFEFIGLDPSLAPKPRFRDENARYANLVKGLPPPTEHDFQKKYQKGTGYSFVKDRLVRIVERLALPAAMANDGLVCRLSRDVASVSRTYRRPVAEMGYDVDDFSNVRNPFASVVAEARGTLSGFSAAPVQPPFQRSNATLAPES